MHYYLKIVCSTFSLALLGSCNGNEDSKFQHTFTHDALPDKIELKGEKHSFDEIMSPRNVLLVSNYMVVSERGRQDDLLHIIDMDTWEYLRSTGKNGMGPGESTVAWKLEHAMEDDAFWSYDIEQKLYSKFYVNDTTKLAAEQYKQGEAIFMASNIMWLDEETLLAEMVDGKNKYFKISKFGDTLNIVGEWDNIIDEREIPHNVISSIHQGKTAISADRSKVIKVGLQRDFIDVYDTSSDSLFTIFGPDNEMPDFQVDYSAGYPMALLPQERKVYYWDAFAGESAMYLLYYGDIRENMHLEKSFPKVLVLDYDGNPLAHYQLDFAITAIAVDENRRLFYGLDYDENPNVVSFEF